MNSSKNNFTTQTLRILIIPSEITQIHTYVEDYLKNPYRTKDKRQEFIRQLKSVESVKSHRLSENRKNILEKDNLR